MIRLNSLRESALQSVPAGHLAILRHSGAKYVICCKSKTEGVISIVYLLDNAAPRFEQFRTQDVSCIDLGPFTVIAKPDLASFSSDTRYSAAGNLLVDDEGLVMICQRSDYGDEVRIDVQTGETRESIKGTWYVPAWELGIGGQDGKFSRLYAWKSPLLP